MSELTKKNGNLRGVKWNYTDNDKDAIIGRGIQGWPVWSKKGYKFALYLEVDGHNVEIVLSQEALNNMIDAISGAQYPTPLFNTSTCTVDGCTCGNKPLNFNLQY
jgi:hypothetical protein